jgi:hypothetical protein
MLITLVSTIFTAAFIYAPVLIWRYKISGVAFYSGLLEEAISSPGFQNALLVASVASLPISFDLLLDFVFDTITNFLGKRDDQKSSLHVSLQEEFVDAGFNLRCP